jgi:hypothetical protein
VERLHEAIEPWIDVQRAAAIGPDRSPAEWVGQEEAGERRDTEGGHPVLVALRRAFVSTEFGDTGGGPHRHANATTPEGCQMTPNTDTEGMCCVVCVVLL